MDYLELVVTAMPPELEEILVFRLSGLGFDSFATEQTEFRAYIPADLYRKEATEDFFREYGTEFSIRQLPDINWNEEWEKNFSPVMIAGRCFVRAPFHPPDPDAGYEIIIEPKMSFGTAHHETTFMMVEGMLETSFHGTEVLDMGCGTGILAILAAKLGAKSVLAIDNDTWAFENTLENIERNGLTEIGVLLGGKEQITGLFHRILANINRNILLDQIPVYASALEPDGVLMVSGFYTSDLPAIRESAEKCGLNLETYRSRNDWVAATFSK